MRPSTHSDSLASTLKPVAHAMKNKLVVLSSTENLEKIRNFVAASAETLGVAQSTIEDLQLAVDEAVTNIIEHGYDTESGNIEVHIYTQENKVVVSIRDDAPNFDLQTFKQPDLSISPLDKDAPGGYGVSLITLLTDDIQQRLTESGQNELLLIKRCGNSS